MRNTESMGSRGRGGLPQRPRALPTPVLLCGYGTAPWALPERTSKCSLEAWSPNSLQGPEPRNWGPLILSHLHQPAALVKNDGTKAGPTASLRLLGGWVEYDPQYREEREVTFSVSVSPPRPQGSEDKEAFQGSQLLSHHSTAHLKTAVASSDI